MPRRAYGSDSAANSPVETARAERRALPFALVVGDLEGVHALPQVRGLVTSSANERDVPKFDGPMLPFFEGAFFLLTSTATSERGVSREPLALKLWRGKISKKTDWPERRC